MAAVYADMLNYRAGIKQLAGATYTGSAAPVAVGGRFNRGRPGRW